MQPYLMIESVYSEAKGCIHFIMRPSVSKHNINVERGVKWLKKRLQQKRKSTKGIP